MAKPTRLPAPKAEAPAVSDLGVLTVKPIDLDEPGSHGQRLDLRRAIRLLRTGEKSGDIDQIMDAQDAIDELIVGRLSTSDGSPVLAEVRKLPGNRYDALLNAILGGDAGGGSSVPPTNSAQSNGQPLA